MKTSELTGLALRWAVAETLGLNPYLPAYAAGPWIQLRDARGYTSHCPVFEESWYEAGPIIEREWIAITRAVGGHWVASSMHPGGPLLIVGPTPLIAAMRCYVASKLGDEVEIPPELA